MHAMFPLMQMTRDAQGLVVSYHVLVGATLIALSLVLLAATFLRRHLAKRRWTVIAAILVAGWSGAYFATFRATLTPDSATVYAFMRYDHVFTWRDTAEVYLATSRGGDAYIVLVDRARRTLEVNVSDLAPGDREHVVAYMLTRIGPAEPPRHTPTRLERPSSRSLHPLSDQQI